MKGLGGWRQHHHWLCRLLADLSIYPDHFLVTFQPVRIETDLRILEKCESANGAVSKHGVKRFGDFPQLALDCGTDVDRILAAVTRQKRPNSLAGFSFKPRQL